MKKIVLTALLMVLALGAPIPAEARVHVSLGFGCCWWGPGWWGYPYDTTPYYYAPYYAAPPVVYAPATPSVVYTTPAPSVNFTPSPVIQATQTSPVFTDAAGRTCRQFKATSGSPAYGTACLQGDGTWRVTQ